MYRYPIHGRLSLAVDHGYHDQQLRKKNNNFNYIEM